MRKIRLLGTLTQFDTVKGFGFIRPDSSSEGGRTTLIHRSVFSAAGVCPMPGGRLLCEVEDGRAPGPRATKILLAQTPPQAVPARVISFNRARGYGFLKSWSGRQIFCHMQLVRQAGLSGLELGQTVMVIARLTERGYRAASLFVEPPPSASDSRAQDFLPREDHSPAIGVTN
jgi:cold shock CspA family protein